MVYRYLEVEGCQVVYTGKVDYPRLVSFMLKKEKMISWGLLVYFWIIVKLRFEGF